jgi:hypothetical protein
MDSQDASRPVLRLSKSERNPNSSRWNSIVDGLEPLAIRSNRASNRVTSFILPIGEFVAIQVVGGSDIRVPHTPHHVKWVPTVIDQ